MTTPLFNHRIENKDSSPNYHIQHSLHPINGHFVQRVYRMQHVHIVEHRHLLYEMQLKLNSYHCPEHVNMAGP